MSRHTRAYQHPQTIRRASKDIRQPERDPAKDSLDHFERFCFTLKLVDTYAPFRLEDWQLCMLKDYFGEGDVPDALEHLWELPTGQGKSALMGALVLHHGTYVRANPNVIILGGLGGHGKHTLNAAKWYIGQSPMLQQWWVPQEYGMGRIRSIIHEDSDGKIVVSSAGRRVGGRGGTSQEGEGPTLVVVEELHRHEDNGSAVRTLTTKVQKRTMKGLQVRIVHGTTAGDTMESPLGRLEKRATAEGSRISHPVVASNKDGEHYYTRAVDAEGDLVMHRWAVPEEIECPPPSAKGDELDRYLAIVKKANPASFITVRNLRRSWKAAQGEIWVFLRQHCNQWIAQNQVAFNKWDLAQCLDKDAEIPPTEDDVFIGLDTATAWATTAIVPVWINPVSGRSVCASSVILESDERGTKRRIRGVVDVLEAMRQRWPNLVLVFDRNIGGGYIAEQMEEDHGMTVIDHGQGTPMEFASMLLGEIIAQHELEYDGNEKLKAHLLAATARKTYYQKRWRLEKPRGGDPIDGAVALAMAVNAARQDDAESVNIDDYRVEGL